MDVAVDDFTRITGGNDVIILLNHFVSLSYEFIHVSPSNIALISKLNENRSKVESLSEQKRRDMLLRQTLTFLSILFIKFDSSKPEISAPPNPIYFFYRYPVVTAAFLIFIWLKPASKRVYLPLYFPPFFFFPFPLASVSISIDKYQLHKKQTLRDILFPVLWGDFIIFSAVIFLIVFFQQFDYSRMIVFGTRGFLPGGNCYLPSCLLLQRAAGPRSNI